MSSVALNQDHHTMNTPTRPICPACRQGHLHPATAQREFHPRGRLVQVEVLTSECDHCGITTIRAAQHDENLQRLAARRRHYGNLLLGEDLVALRLRYGLTQQQACLIFGKSKIAFSRYENEATYPDDSTTLLLRMAIEHPEFLKALADKAGVEIPLWKERCEDAQREREKQHPAQHVVLPSLGSVPADLHRSSFTISSSREADRDLCADAS